jgi:nicotinamidase-related amidase
MLKTQDTVLVLVDFQGKLARIVQDSDAVIASARRLVRGAGVLDVPVLWTEQNPRGLGATVPELAELLPGEPIAKLSFSCCGEGPFVEALERVGRKGVLLAGIEAHVCVYQTAADLLESGYEVEVVADAVSSRTAENKAIALARMRQLGAAITSVEMVLFELLGRAEGPRFKRLLEIVK